MLFAIPVPRLLAASILSLSLVACGGGDGSPSASPPDPTPGTISYPAQPAFNVGNDYSVTPAVTGTVASYHITPALPAGLALDASNGRITGSPLETSETTTYTVSATSAGSAVNATVSLTVKERLPAISMERIYWQYTRTQPVSMPPPVNTGGPVTNWSISPALPTGLSLDSTTGRITGTALVAAPNGEYTLTGSNPGGSDSMILVIDIVDVRPQFSFRQSPVTLTKGTAASVLPEISGGNAPNWSVAPALPAGLTLDASSGAIFGTPTTRTAATDYVVSATNAGGTSSATVSISVAEGVLVDLGQSGGIGSLIHHGNRIMSIDDRQRGVLWNAQTGAIIASRNDLSETGSISGCGPFCNKLIGLGGNTAVFRSLRWLILLDATNGNLLAHVLAPSDIYWWRVSIDGSYVVAATNTGLSAWSRTGTRLFTKTGNYIHAKPFAAANELRIGAGPAGAGVVETIAMPSGTATTTTGFQGTFNAWFDDGEKFITNIGDTVWVYSRNMAQLDFKALTNVTELSGHGDWFWARRDGPGSLDIYAVGASTNVAASYGVDVFTEINSAGDTIGIVPYVGNVMSVVDLSGGSPTKTDYSAPVSGLQAYAADSKDDWVVGAATGVMLGELTGTPQIYSHGEVQSIAANASDILIATGSGHILDYDASSRALKRDITYRATKMELSADGTQLVAGTTAFGFHYEPAKNLRVYSLATGDVQQEWTYPDGGPVLFDFDVADSADVLAQSVGSGTGDSYNRIVTTLGNTPIWSSAITGYFSLYLSPNGQLGAVAPAQHSAGGGTNVFTNGTLTGAVFGSVGGWLDDSRLLVNRYLNDKYGVPVFSGVDVMSTAGVVQASLATGSVFSAQVVSPNSFYDPSANKIYDATTGAILFSTSDTPLGTGAVSGANVVFATGSLVRIESR
jgi:hypothetical protein